MEPVATAFNPAQSEADEKLVEDHVDDSEKDAKDADAVVDNEDDEWDRHFDMWIEACVDAVVDHEDDENDLAPVTQGDGKRWAANKGYDK